MPLPFLLNPTLAQLPVYQPGRPIPEVARELGLDPGDIIKLASNENPLGPSPKAMAAMRGAIDHLHLYPDGNAFYLKQRLGDKLGLEAGHLILGNGSNEIIEFVGHAFVQPGAEVIVSQYCFAIYPIIAHLFGGKLITVPALDLGHDLPAMLRAVTPRTRVVFVANPNNPTGTLASSEALADFVRQVPAHVVIALDEAYLEFLEQPADFVQWVRENQTPNLLLMRTFSKIYGLAGLRLGYGIGSPTVIAALEKIRQPFNLNSLAQAAATAAIDDEEHVQRTRANNRVGLQYFQTQFREQSLRYVPSAANFILVHVGDGGRVCAAMQTLGVITRPMAGYGLSEWLRISIGTMDENRRCFAALQAGVAQVAASS